MKHRSLSFLLPAALCLLAVWGCRSPTPAATPQATMPAPEPIQPSPTITSAAAEPPLYLSLSGYLGNSPPTAVAADERRAVVGAGRLLTIIDTADPAKPRYVGQALLPRPVSQVLLAGEYAYAATVNGPGLFVLELAGPQGPRIVDGVLLGDVRGMAVVGGRLIVATDALRILDLADPAHPKPVNAPEMDRRPMTRRLGPVAAGGDLVYASFFNPAERRGGLLLMDVSDPQAPASLATVDLGGQVEQLVAAGNYVYALTGGALLIVDASDPRAPVVVSPALDVPGPLQFLAGDSRRLYLLGARPEDGGQVVGLADPLRPTVEGRLGLPDTPPTGLAAADGLAYVTGQEGLVILSVGEAGTKTVGRYPLAHLPEQLRSVAADGSYAYLAAGQAGLRVVDASDPALPVIVGGLDTAGHSWDVALTDGLALLADEYNGLRLIDLADPSRPVEIGAFDVPGVAEFIHAVDVSGRLAFLADGNPEETGLRIVDLSDPGRPRELAFWRLPPVDRPLPPRVEDVVVGQGYAYVAAGTAGLRVLDISDPAQPVEVGAYETPGRANNLALVNGLLLLVDGDLRLVDVRDPRQPALVGFLDLAGAGEMQWAVPWDNHAVISDAGVTVFDVRDPGQPAWESSVTFVTGRPAVSAERLFLAGSQGLFILEPAGR